MRHTVEQLEAILAEEEAACAEARKWKWRRFTLAVYRDGVGVRLHPFYFQLNWSTVGEPETRRGVTIGIYQCGEQ
jgi:hypothetical protein